MPGRLRGVTYLPSAGGGPIAYRSAEVRLRDAKEGSPGPGMTSGTEDVVAGTATTVVASAPSMVAKIGVLVNILLLFCFLMSDVGECFPFKPPSKLQGLLNPCDVCGTTVSRWVCT